MKQSILVLLAFASVLPCAARAQQASAGETDSVAARLAERDIRSEVDEDGDYKITYAWQEEDRSQLVFVAGRTNEVAGHVIREVFAPAARVPEDGLAPELANRLLRDSQDKILGSWEVAGQVLFYVVKLPDDADAALLKTALDIAAETADDMEIELTDGKDEF